MWSCPPIRQACALRACVIVLLLGFRTSALSRHSLIADAGSTGTRMYLFRLQELPEGPKLDITDLGKGPALSSFENSPSDAPDAVRHQIEVAKGMLPEQDHSSVTVSIFATAGMRLLDKARADAVYKGLRTGLLDEAYPFDRAAFQARTISGEEEGSFAMVAANYLAGHISMKLEMTSSHLMGVLDLGGSSTQIAIPPQLIRGASLAQNLGPNQADVRSFLSFGMERMRQHTYKHLVSGADAAARAHDAAPNPCAFYGYREPGHGWRGTGDAKACQATIKALMTEQTLTCRRRSEARNCIPMELPRLAVKPVSAQEPCFFLISAYMFATDFARWWLNISKGSQAPDIGDKKSADLRLMDRVAAASPEMFARPTIAELRTAAALLCAAAWENLTAAVKVAGHQFTSPHKAPHRCFELNYIVTLLSVGYGFREDVRAFEVAASIGGRELEWTLGAFLLGPFMAKGGGSLSLRHQNFDQSSNNALLIAPLVGIIVYAARRCWAYMNPSPGLHVN